jgi:hypothetical protein
MVIWAAVGINTGLGIVPFDINIRLFVGVVTVVAMTLGAIYDYHYSHDDAAKFFTRGLKGHWGHYPRRCDRPGMALDAILCAWQD